MLIVMLTFLSAGVVNERIREAHQNKFAPKMMLFPGFSLCSSLYFRIIQCTSLKQFLICPLVNYMKIKLFVDIFQLRNVSL